MAVAGCLAAAPAAVRGEAVADSTHPTKPGMHHLSFDWEHEGKAEGMAYGLFIPDGYPEAVKRGEKVSLIVYLCGAGSRGFEENKLYRNGPLAEMRRNKHLVGKVESLVVAPQLPRGARWENARMGRYIADTTRRVIERWRVDPDRVYLMGASMGGEGVWHAALAGPDLYALVLSMGGRKHPEPAKVAEALKGASAWIIVGARDRDFTTGSRAMRDAFKEAGVDLIYSELRGYGHNIWRLYWNKAEFYEAVSVHRRGKAPPPNRGDAEALTDIAKLPPPDPGYARFANELQKAFERFRPWWQIENCRRHDSAGMHEKWGGREGVLATMPLNRHMPCRLMTTAEIPEGKKTKLVVEVAADKKHWLLQIDADNKLLHRTRVEPTNQGEGSPWRKVEVDLSAYAGEKVFLELLHLGFRHHRRPGYWSGIELVSE